MEGQVLFKVISGEGRSAAYYIRIFPSTASTEISLPPCEFNRSLTLVAPSTLLVLGHGYLRALRDKIIVAKGGKVKLSDIDAKRGPIILRVDIDPDASIRSMSDDDWCETLLAEARTPGLPGLSKPLESFHGESVFRPAPVECVTDITGGSYDLLGPTTASCVQDTVVFELAPERAVPFTLHMLQDTVFTLLASDDPSPEVEMVDLRRPAGPLRPRNVYRLDSTLPTMLTVPACCAYRLGGRGTAILRLEYRLYSYPSGQFPPDVMYGRDFRSILQPDDFPMQVPPDLPLPPRLLRLFARNDFVLSRPHTKA